MDLATITQTISQKFRYRQLSEVTGRTIVIKSLADIERDVLQAFPDLLPTQCKLVNTYNPALSIKKFDILTLDFRVPAVVLADGYETGTAILKKLGYVDNPEAENVNRSIAEVLGGDLTRDPLLRDVLLEDLELDQTYLKVQLKPDQGPTEPSGVKHRQYLSTPLPDDYFPREFKVKRACFANSKLVWLHTYGIGISIL